MNYEPIIKYQKESLEAIKQSLRSVDSLQEDPQGEVVDRETKIAKEMEITEIMDEIHDQQMRWGEPK